MNKKIEYLLIDGYNLIFSWPKLNKIAISSLEDARNKLLEILCDYQGYKQSVITVVFDAHLTKKSMGTVDKYKNIFVVYTQSAETADNFIERIAASLAKRDLVRVVTSDYLEQIIILGRGAVRVSTAEFQREIDRVKKEIRQRIVDTNPIKRNQLMDLLDEETAKRLENMRRGIEP